MRKTSDVLIIVYLNDEKMKLMTIATRLDQDLSTPTELHTLCFDIHYKMIGNGNKTRCN